MQSYLTEWWVRIAGLCVCAWVSLDILWAWLYFACFFPLFVASDLLIKMSDLENPFENEMFHLEAAYPQVQLFK